MRRTPWWIVPIAALLLVGLASSVDAHPRRVFVAPAFVPAGVHLLPNGVFFIREGATEIFWAEGFFWAQDPLRNWYRAPFFEGPWFGIDSRWVPPAVLIVSHHPYRDRGAWIPWHRWARQERFAEPPPRRYDGRFAPDRDRRGHGGPGGPGDRYRGPQDRERHRH